MFHKVLLLSEGNPLYFGNGADVMAYFASIGYAPSVAMNPYDFLLDLANGIASDDSHENQAVVKHALVSPFKSHPADNLKAQFHDSNASHLRDEVEDKQFAQLTTTWWQQFFVLLRRGVKETRHKSFSGLKIAQVLAVSFLIGLRWWQSDVTHLQDQVTDVCPHITLCIKYFLFFTAPHHIIS